MSGISCRSRRTISGRPLGFSGRRGLLGCLLVTAAMAPALARLSLLRRRLYSVQELHPTTAQKFAFANCTSSAPTSFHIRWLTTSIADRLFRLGCLILALLGYLDSSRFPRARRWQIYILLLRNGPKAEPGCPARDGGAYRPMGQGGQWIPDRVRIPKVPSSTRRQFLRVMPWQCVPRRRRSGS